MLKDTIRANLLWASPGASEDDIALALEQAAARDFVMALPQGLDTVLGDRGSGLSGGEMQRISLARALLRRPRLLVLDEATSALDYVNEKIILNTLQQLRNKTSILLVTHRFTAVQAADEVYELRGGQLYRIPTAPQAGEAKASA